MFQQNNRKIDFSRVSSDSQRSQKIALNENVGIAKLLLYQPFIFFPADLTRFVHFHFFIVITCTFLIWYQSLCLNLIVVQVTVTFKDVCWSIRNITFINKSFYNMGCLVMFTCIPAVCLIFLLKLKTTLLLDTDVTKQTGNSSITNWIAIFDSASSLFEGTS